MVENVIMFMHPVLKQRQCKAYSKAGLNVYSQREEKKEVDCKMKKNKEE